MNGYNANGEKHGPWEGYYRNGKLRWRGKYVNGKRYGLWKFHYRAINVSEICFYKNDGVIGFNILTLPNNVVIKRFYI